MEELDCLIVGGGPHGVHIAARLLEAEVVDPARLRIVDPADALLSTWRRCTHATGMTHLRSPSVHHLDPDPWSLKRMAGKRRHRAAKVFIPPYDRPSLELFERHSDGVIARFGLASLHTRARARRCRPQRDGVLVDLDDGQELATRRVVLALGASEQPAWPVWAPRGDARVQHIFAPELQSDAEFTSERIAVVGGGISAAQVALRLVARGHRVTLVARHAQREAQFDSDPGWLGPRFMVGFAREKDLDRRREIITKARHRGSVPPEVARALASASSSSPGAPGLRRLEAAIESLELGPGGAGVSLRLAGGALLELDRVILATGFALHRPGGALVDDLVLHGGLPCARCGYPIVDTGLRWHPRIHVSGPLAELELGPAARNISGARRAGERILGALANGRGAGGELRP